MCPDAAWFRSRDLARRALAEARDQAFRESLVAVPANWRALCIQLLVATRGAPPKRRQFVCDMRDRVRLTPRQAAYFESLWLRYVGEPALDLDPSRSQPSQY